MPEWRDIASAPKDGTRILAFGMAYAELAENGDTWVIADDRKPRQPFMCIMWWEERWIDGEVSVGDGLYRKEPKKIHDWWRPHGPYAFTPTHWMPLPAVPEGHDR